jgi:hypothetical protein
MRRLKMNKGMYSAILFMTLLLPASALAKDVYPNRSLGDIYVLATEGNWALMKAKGVNREYVTLGDVIGEERMVVVEIDSLSVMVKSTYGDTVAKLPVGGGMAY